MSRIYNIDREIERIRDEEHCGKYREEHTLDEGICENCLHGYECDSGIENCPLENKQKDGIMKFLVATTEKSLGKLEAASLEEAQERVYAKLKEMALPVDNVKIEEVKVPIVRNVKNLDKRDQSYLYIGRGSKWGNPYIMQTNDDRDSVIEQYEQMIRNKPELLKQLHELNGKTLACYCYPLKCHGDVLVKLFKENFAPEDINKPVCYRPNNGVYPLCKGTDSQEEVNKKKCNDCNLYENMDESKYDANYAFKAVDIP